MHYLRFLNIINAAQELTEWPKLDPGEQAFLDQLAVLWGKGQSVTIMEAANFGGGVSSSTYHRRIKQLVKLDILKICPLATDARVKLLQPTQRTQDYWARIDLIIAQSK